MGMGEGLQARPSSYSTTARSTGSGLEALTHWPAVISVRKSNLSYVKLPGQPASEYRFKAYIQSSEYTILMYFWAR